MKKGLSILLALTLLVSILVPVPVLGTNGDVGKDVTITVTGGITTIGTFGEVLGGVLPTTANLDFTIDPMNLAGLEVDAIVDTAARNSAVTFNDNLLRAWNTSSVPVLLTANLKVTSGGTPPANPVLTEVAVTNGDTANILLWVQPNATIQNTNDATFSGASQVIPFDNDNTIVEFRLPAREHNLHVVDPKVSPIEVQLRPDPAAPALNGTSFAFGGIINVTDDAVAAWGDVDTIGVVAVFSMKALLDTDDNAAARAAAFRTDGDVTIAEGMLASYDGYTAPPLIALPEGGGASGGPSGPSFDFIVPLEGGSAWAVIPGVPAFLGASINDVYTVASHSMFWYTDQTLMINFTTAGEYSVWINTGNTDTSRVVTVLVTN